MITSSHRICRARRSGRHGAERDAGQRAALLQRAAGLACSRRPRPIAKKMDALGFDTLWLAEHHFQHEGYECIPNILMLAVHLAHVTKRLRIGCGFNIAPMWHPLRLAEDYAAADILTKGRTVFGVGRGYHTREVETFGAPMLDADANRELFEEQVEIIFKAFNAGVLLAQGQALHAAARRALSRLPAQGAHAGAAPDPPARRVLAADRQRQPARARLHGQARHQGRRRRRRGDHGGEADHGLSRCRGARRARTQARREPQPRHLLPPGRDAASRRSARSRRSTRST